MTKIEEFEERVSKDKIECPICAGKTILEFTEYELQHSGALLKYTFYCNGCELTFSGCIY